MFRIPVVLFVLLCCLGMAVAAVEPPAPPPALAVLVHADPGAEALADQLRPLLETEASRSWEGPLLERAEIDALLREMTLSGAASPEGDGVRVGTADRAAYLISARVSAGVVRATVNSFPKTEIVFDGEYRDRLEAESLAVRVADDALRAIRSRRLDLRAPYVGIGSIYCVDPHLRFLEFGRAAGVELRTALGKAEGLRLVERQFPSDLLNELELSRAGVTVGRATDTSVPPADLLFYAECIPQRDQDLNAPGILLDCTLTVVSPTDLVPPKSAQMVCKSDDPAALAARARQLIVETAVAARARLAAGQARGFSENEFETFKKQAFRLMPSPPLDGGIFYKKGGYRGPDQSGRPEEQERSLRMLECAMLFRGDDPALLDCTAAVLYTMARHGKRPESVKVALHSASLDLVERAYRLQSDWNTRAFYLGQNTPDPLTPAAMKPRMKEHLWHIWATHNTEPWHEFQIDELFHALLKEETEPRRQQALYLEAAPGFEARANGLRPLFNAFGTFIQQVQVADSLDNWRLAEHERFARTLTGAESPVLRACGHLLHLAVDAKREELRPDPANMKNFVGQFGNIVDLLPALHEQHGKNFIDSNYLALVIGYIFNARNLEKHGLNGEMAAVQERYIAVELRAGNYGHSYVNQMLMRVLPVLHEQGRDARAVELITQFLNHYDFGGSADYERMQFARELNRSDFALHGAPLRLAQLGKIPFDDGGAGWVPKLAASPSGLYGVRAGSWYTQGGKAFRFDPAGTTATMLKQVTAGPVIDLACTDGFVGVGTEKGGFFLLKAGAQEAKQLTPDNSALPGGPVGLVGSAGGAFFLGIRDKDNSVTLIYKLDPAAGRFSATDIRLQAHDYWRLTTNPAGDPPVLAQTWNRRIATAGGNTFTLSVTPEYVAVKDAVVTLDGTAEFRYHGFALNYVFDFTVWQDHIVFATGNGLYAARRGTNTLRCLLSEPDLLIFSFCVLKDRAYLGTSKGLYILDGALFKQAMGGG
jgi:hypothetical protein